MSNSSILGGQPAANRAAGRDVDALGPSDSSDSGSDVQGERPMSTAADNPGEFGAVPVDGRNDSDALGTGERASADGDDPADGADILPDRIIDTAAEDIDDDDAALAIDGDTDVEDLAADDAQLDELDDDGAGEAVDIETGAAARRIEREA